MRRPQGLDDGLSNSLADQPLSLPKSLTWPLPCAYTAAILLLWYHSTTHLAHGYTRPVLQEASVTPGMILGTRWRELDGARRCEVKISWQGLPDALATWEDREELRARFPDHPAWGQAGSQEEGNVMDQLTDVAQEPFGKQRRRFRRAGRRPARLSGPEWTV